VDFKATSDLSTVYKVLIFFELLVIFDNFFYHNFLLNVNYFLES